MKRGILVLVLLVLNVFYVNAFTSDSFSLVLTHDKIGSNQNFDGYLEINSTQELDKSAPLVFIINSKKQYSKPIDWVLNGTDLQLLPKAYQRVSSSIASRLSDKFSDASSSSKQLSFSSPGSKVELGIDLAAAGSKQDTISQDQISKFQIAFNGATINGKYPTASLDIGNDQSVDYTYKGDLTGQFEDQDSSYLADNIPDLWKGIRPSLDTFCQKVYLKPSAKFKISARLQKLKEGAELKATIAESPLQSMTCEDTEKCCNLNPTITDSEISCDLDMEVNEASDYYICVSSFTSSEDIESAYYQIAADQDPAKVQGYYNGQTSPLDYFIKVKRALFQTAISQQTSQKDIPVEGLISYISTPACGNECLLVPINVSSSNPGKLTLNNFMLSYVDSGTGPTTITSLVNIEALGERLNLSYKSLRIPLSKFEDLFAPTELQDNTIIASIYGFNSNQVKFKTVPAPTIYIGLSNINPGVGEEVTFTAYGFSSGDRTASSYAWDFGDKTNASGSTAKHSYTSSGTYNIVLTVIDSSNYTAKQRASINVTSSGSVGSSQFDLALNKVKSTRLKFESESSQVKDTISILGINSVLDGVESNITELNKSLSQKLAIAKTDTEKATITSSINSQLALLISKIPKSIAVTVSTFSPKLGSVSQIPNEVASTNEIKQKVLKANQEITVNGEARIITIDYDSGSESFILVKKVVSSTTDQIYEVLPLSAVLDRVLTEGSISVTPDRIFKISGTDTFTYLMQGTDLSEALQTKTIVFPEDIESIEITDNVETETPTSNIQVGSNLSRILVVIVTVIIIGLIFYFALVFKGGLLNKKPAKTYFKNLNDYFAVKKFIADSLNKKIKEEDIKITLKKRSWKDNQINAVLKEIKDEQNKAKKEAEKKKINK